MDIQESLNFLIGLEYDVRINPITDEVSDVIIKKDNKKLCFGLNNQDIKGFLAGFLSAVLFEKERK